MSISTDYANIRNELTEVTFPIPASPVAVRLIPLIVAIVVDFFSTRNLRIDRVTVLPVVMYLSLLHVLSPLRYSTFLHWILKFLYQERKERTKERRTRTYDWRRNNHLQRRNTIRATRWRKYFEDRQSPKSQTKRRIRQMDFCKTTITEYARKLQRSWDTWTIKMSFESYALLTSEEHVRDRSTKQAWRTATFWNFQARRRVTDLHDTSHEEHWVAPEKE